MIAYQTVQHLKAQLITPENFRSYGQVIFPESTDKVFDEKEAQLIIHFTEK